jgi:LuxR family transcriptional regulator, maltose regulon positive regulatory protein
MSLSDMVIRSKLIPPRPHLAIYHRPRLAEKLAQSSIYPITLVHAGTGFGKTTALIQLSKAYNHVYWYHITEPDRDPTLFLAHLFYSLMPISSSLLDQFEEGGLYSASRLINVLSNQLTTDLEEDAILVLDDFHLVSSVREINQWLEQLIEHRPPFLHIAIACRHIPDMPAYVRWRVKGDILLVDQTDLSFDAEEICSLFSHHYNFPVKWDQAQNLYAYTDGWIIALQMVWQRLQKSRSKRLDNILAQLPTALPEIFNFLAQEVLMRQDETIQQFLVRSSILRQLDAHVCNHLLNVDNSQNLLQQLNERGLFITTTDNLNFHYQRLFHDFLLTQLKQTPGLIDLLHEKAAEYYKNRQDFEEAIYHLLAGGNQASAAKLIHTIGQHLLEIGRIGTLVKWIEQLDQQNLDEYPALNLLQGDALRLSSKFEESIAWYNAAEKIYAHKKDLPGRSNALKSKAQVYLDTIRPLKASSLLLEALALLEPQEHPIEVANLLDLLSENKLNLGKPEEALALHKEANVLRAESDHDDIYLESRALLRTGRLHEAITIIESSGALIEDPTKSRPQRFHREMPLLLSLIYLMLGDIQESEQNARKGIEIGSQLDSHFVEAVGWMRLGHVYQLYPQAHWRKNRTQKALDCYERAINLVRPINVIRVQVEPLWGLCRFHGYQGNINEALPIALHAIEIAQAAGDYWLVALLRTTMGTSYMLAGETDSAQAWLSQAVEDFIRVGDRFGQSAAKCAQTLNLWLRGSRQEALHSFAALAPQLKAFNLSFLLTQPSHLGLQDTQSYLPLLVEASNQGIEPDWLALILREKNLEGIEYHPGYGLDIQCLGAFEVWRGKDLITAKDWQRGKARQLFQFFISHRGKWFSREQITDRLWPHLDLDSSAQNLKVVLNALNRALEPQREAGQIPFFIIRRDNLYGLNPAAQINLDVEDFLSLSSSGSEQDLEEALLLYGGDYLSDTVDEPWANETRDRMKDVFIETGQRLSSLYYSSDQFDEAIKSSHRILTVDACSEMAYQMLMKCHAAKGNRAAVNAVYRRCVAVIQEELDVPPSHETTMIWEELNRGLG